MKSNIIIGCLVLCCCVNSMMAQETIKRNMINSTKVTLIANSSFHSKGALYQVKDSSIMLSSSRRVMDYRQGNSDFSITEIPVIDIQLIKTVSKKRVRNAALIGAGVGIVTGVMMGMASDPGWLFTRGQVVTGIGVFLGATGAVTGALIGSIGINIPINGSMDNYNRKKAKLVECSIYK